MPDNNYCPFQLFSEAKVDCICKKSECELWSVSQNTCCIQDSIRHLRTISDSLSRLIALTEIKVNHKN